MLLLEKTGYKLRDRHFATSGALACILSLLALLLLALFLLLLPPVLLSLAILLRLPPVPLLLLPPLPVPDLKAELFVLLPFVASLLLGVADVAGKYYLSSALGGFVIYVVLIVVLVVRPQGLFARAR